MEEWTIRMYNNYDFSSKTSSLGLDFTASKPKFLRFFFYIGRPRVYEFV